MKLYFCRKLRNAITKIWLKHFQIRNTYLKSPKLNTSLKSVEIVGFKEGSVIAYLKSLFYKASLGEYVESICIPLLLVL